LAREAKGISEDTDAMMKVVREKLLGREWPVDQKAALDASSIAVLSSRLLLDLSPSASQTRMYEEELVRSKLRYLYSVHQNLETKITGSSPEPLVAEAAAQIMHFEFGSETDKRPYMDVWRLFTEFVEEGLAPQGTVGELIGRILSILAMDDAIDGLEDHCELKYQTPVLVSAYYRALLTDEAWDELRKSVPANRAQLCKDSGNKTFESAFANAYLHFSHYGKANDNTPIQDRYAWALWLRGTAILCQLNQELTDRALPIFFSEQETLSPESVSMIFDQDKTGQSTSPNNVGIQSAEDLRLFTQGQNHPYIAAVHCYALTKDEGITVTVPPLHDLRGAEKDTRAPRYQIDFRGLSAYRKLTTSMKADVRRMIDGSKNYIFNHHPRQYGVPALRQALPVLDQDSYATAWFGGLPDDQSKGKGKEKA
jgi:hypothetical protein